MHYPRILIIPSLILALASTALTGARSGNITTYAGGPGHGPGTSFGQGVYSVAIRGKLVYTSDFINKVVRVLDETTGNQRVVAGNLAPGFSGDGGPATKASFGFFSPAGVAVDSAGNIYIADPGNLRIRKIDTAGIITTFAGNGTPGYSGDGGPATSAQFFYYLSDVAADSKGNVFIADQFSAVRKVDTSGIITTVASVSATGVAVDSAGTLYIADGYTSVYKLNARGKLVTVAGNGTAGFSGDGGPATKAQLNSPRDISLDASGNLYIADAANNRIRKVDTSGIVTTVAGNGMGDFSGDGGPALSASLNFPIAVETDSAGNLFIADNARLREVNTSGIINTVAGNGQFGAGPDGGPPPTHIELGLVEGLAMAPDGSLYMAADINNGTIRKVSPAGVVTTVVGTGFPGYSGDGGPARKAQLYGARDCALDAAGNLYIADTDNSRIRKVNRAGIITTVAGNGVPGYSGDGGRATSAKINYPYALEVDADGTIYIADTGTSCVRKVTPAGIITTIAGIAGLYGNTGDGGRATRARLNLPEGVALDRQGNLYVSDFNNCNVRKIDTAGIITTVAGNGVPGFSGDYGPATAAQLLNPTGLILDSAGNLYIADTFSNRVRRVNTAGIIHTVAGTGAVGNSTGGFRGDRGPAKAALLNAPIGLTLDSFDNLYIGDFINQRVRRVHNP